MNTRVKPFNPTKIHIMVYENGATLEEVAAEYGMSVEEFCKRARMVVGSKKLENMKKICSRNVKTRRKEQEKLERRNKPKAMQKAPAHEESVEEKKERLQKSIEQAQSKATQEYNLIRQMFEFCKTKERQQGDAEKNLLMARETLRQAEKAFLKAQQEYENAEKEKSSHEANFLMWRKQRKTMQRKLDELNKDNIYLIAPNYIGELPRVGRFISTENISNVSVEIEHGSVLMEEPIHSTDDSNYISALEFAKLVLKYYLGDQSGQITVLVNNDQYRQILELQGIEI